MRFLNRLATGIYQSFQTHKKKYLTTHHRDLFIMCEKENKPPFPQRINFVKCVNLMLKKRKYNVLKQKLNKMGAL